MLRLIVMLGVCRKIIMLDQLVDLIVLIFFVYQVLDFFLVCQFILSCEQDLIGYELLFCSVVFGLVNVKDDVMVMVVVIVYVLELGLFNVIGNLYGFINVDVVVLMSDFIYFLLVDKVVLEILEIVCVMFELVVWVCEFVVVGYVFVLDDVVVELQEIEELLLLVKIIKIDVMEVDFSKLFKLLVYFKWVQKELLVEKVESLQVFNDCMMFGFDYFQGYYFVKLMIFQGKKLEVFKMIIMYLFMFLVCNVDNVEIVCYIKCDVVLLFMLLWLVNMLVYGFQKFIDLLGQVLIVLGCCQLKCWLQIFLFVNIDKDCVYFMLLLMILVVICGKMLELIIVKICLGCCKMLEMVFMVGIMFLVDVLFGMSMEIVLCQIIVSIEICEVLLCCIGFYGIVLCLVECIELCVFDQEEMQCLLEEL